MDEDEDTEQPTPEQGSAAADEPPESPPEEAEESTDDAVVDEEQTAEASAESDAPASDASEASQAAATEEDSATDEDAATAAADVDAEPAGSPVGEDLVGRASQYDEELGAEVAALVERAFELKDDADDLRRRVDELEDERAELEEEREDLKQRLVRKQADFKNYKERAKKKQDQIRDRATEDLVERLLPVRDNLTRALEQEGEDADIREGVEATLRDFDRVLEEENVEEIVPAEGDDVDPQRHEVMVRVDSELPEGDIVDVYRPGYEMADKVIQTAQVTVSNGADHEPEEAVALGGEVETDDDGDDDGTGASETAAADDEVPSGEGDGEAPEGEEATAGDNRH
ncbi:nucleotide exchange factor GrpE [Haloarchaeobius litoreus]|uniref:Protein GrpE n=1 Tax=Haloarchaeobius litoreus TaxID=755306 RepID=A0ABD6DGJ5_9EURY